MKPVLIGSGTGVDLDLIATPSMVKSIRDWVRSDFKITSSYPVSETQLVIEYTDEGDTRKVVEVSLAFPGDTNYEILEIVNKDPVHKGSKQQFLRPEGAILWMLKESHKYKDSLHFEKTRRDVLIYRSSLIGKQNLSRYADLQARREEETYRPKIKLNVSKDDFFSGDGVRYVYDHDWLHTVFAIGDAPAYKAIQRNSEVFCSFNEWKIAKDTIRQNCVIEEAFVIAMERGVIPFDRLDVVTPQEEFLLVKKALQKICTSLTSGWFRTYAWESYDSILERIKEIEATQGGTLGLANKLKQEIKNGNAVLHRKG